MIRYDSAVLITKNVAEMTRFYCDVLAQTLRYDFGRCQAFECGLSIWELDEGDPAMQAPDIGRGPNHNLELCFDTDAFDEDVARILALKPRLLHSVAEEAWGQRTIRLFDPDGNLVELGESIPCFCRRLYHKGLSIKEVAEKTGVASSLVEQYVQG